jgi:hypothetical protein
MNAQEQLCKQDRTPRKWGKRQLIPSVAAPGSWPVLGRLPAPQLEVKKPASANVLLGDMKTESRKPSPGLEKGQLWKTDSTYIQIVELGKRLIHYKMLRQPGQKAVMTRMIGIDALAVYLRANEATLVN